MEGRLTIAQKFQINLTQSPQGQGNLSNYQRERSLSKLRKSAMKNGSQSPQVEKQSSNVEELEKQWNQVKQIHNQFNNYNSPNKQINNSLHQKLNDSQIKFNAMKFVPHYKINLECENDEIPKEKSDYMHVIVQKYGNIHKKQIILDSPQVRVKSLNKNDLKEVKRQASTSQTRNSKNYNSDQNKFQEDARTNSHFTTMPLSTFTLQTQDLYNDNESKARQQIQATCKVIKNLEKRRQSIRQERKSPIVMNPHQNSVKYIVVYQPSVNTTPLIDSSDYNRNKGQRSIMQTPESSQKGDLATPQKGKGNKRQLSPKPSKVLDRNCR